MTAPTPTTGYAPVNDLRMYHDHEIHGDGQPAPPAPRAMPRD